MRIVRLVIDGFRGIKQGIIHFDKHSVLCGPSGCGKSAIIEALALLFGRDRMIKQLTEHDFFGSDPAPHSRIRIVATIADFPQNAPEYNWDWFREGRAVPKWYNPTTKTISTEKTTEEDLLAAEIGFAARFDHETLTVETLRYFHDDDDLTDPFDDEVIAPLPSRLISDLGFFLVPSSRTWDRTMSFGSELFRRLVATLGSIPSKEVLSERNRLRHPDPPLEAVGGLGEVVSRINAEFARVFSSGPQLQLRLTSTDAESLLQAIMPHYKLPSSPSLPARRHGTGLVSLQALILLLELGKARRKKNQSFILAIEEPELHIPPGHQRRLVFRAQSIANQTITISHSPNVVSFYSCTEIQMLRNSAGVLEASPLLPEPLSDAAPNGIRKLYYDSRAELIAALMQERLLVPEGRTDFEWIRLLSKLTETREAWDQTPIDEIPFGAVIGVVPTPNPANLKEVVERLLRVHSSIVLLVDGDKAGNDYIKQFTQSPTSLTAIIQWPSGWSIEDVVCWILEAEESFRLDLVEFFPTATSYEDILQQLKKDTRSGGIKGNYLAYEGLAGVIRNHPSQVKRTAQVLADLCQAILHPMAPGPHFRNHPLSTKALPVLVWSP